MQKKIILLILSIIIVLFCYKKVVTLSISASDDIKKRTEDASYLINFIEQNYPLFAIKKNTLNYDFLEHKDELKNKLINSYSEEEFYENINEVMHLLQNGHSYLMNNKYDHHLSTDFSTRYIQGKYVVTYSKNPQICIGDILIKVEGIPLDKYIKDNLHHFLLKYDFKHNKYYTNSFLFKHNKSSAEITLLDSGQNEKTIKVLINKNHPSSLQCINEFTNVIDFRILDKSNIAYIKIKNFCPLNVNEELDRFKELICKIQNYDKLIIDIRGNTGGLKSFANSLISLLTNKEIKLENYYCFKNTNFINKLIKDRKFTEIPDISPISLHKISTEIKIPKEVKDNNFIIYKDIINIKPSNITFKGNLYLLIDDEVYSAADYFANILKRSHSAKLIGTSTGGDGIGIAPITLILPNSKIPVKLEACIGLDSEGNVNEETYTTPDYYVEQDISKYIEFSKGNITDFLCTQYDSIFDECIKIIN